MIRNDGAAKYKMTEFRFKMEEQVQIDQILQPVYNTLIRLNMKSYLDDGDITSLNQAPLKELLVISSTWEKITFELETVHFKIAVTKEFYLINLMVAESSKIVSQISDIVEKLESELRTDYSQIVNSNDFFSNYFSYKEFKNTFLVLTSPDNITLEKALVLKNESMFHKIRRKIISDKANISYLLSESEKSVLHINEIKKQDLKTYDLIRTEFFVTLCEETMSIKIPYGKKAKTEIIRPSHPMAPKLGMQRSEIVYVTVSLEPIESAGVDLNEVIEFNNGSKFDIVMAQQMIQRDMFYQLKLDKLTTCNLIVPIYFSFIRCNLVKEQRSNYSKLNDKKFLDEISGVIPEKKPEAS